MHRQKANFRLPAHGCAYESAPRRKAIGIAKSQRTELSPREQVAASRRIVVKIGTNVLMRNDGGVSIGAFYGIAESLANFRRAGREVLLVSSGAVGCTS